MPRLLPLILRLRIVTERGELVTLGDVIKRDQLDFIARVQRQLDVNGRARICVLKARQIGISTIVEAIIFVYAMIEEFFKAMVISHENDSSIHILDMTRNYWDTYIFKQFYDERYNGRSHVAWSNHSDIHIATAGNKAVGRSLTLRALHASEVAFWDNADVLMTGLAQSTKSAKIIVLESTANGVGNYFHRQCNKAMKGESDYEFVFYPWWQDPYYTARFLPHEVQNQYSTLGKLDDEEKLLRKMFGLDDGRLLWRRWAIRNLCDGDLSKFHQEYPSTPHEAFISTGRNIFHLPHLLAHYKPRKGLRGTLRKDRGKVKFFEDPLGPLTLYARPSSDRDWGVYIIGADPTHAPGGDFACAQVFNRRTKEQVAVYRRKVDPITFGQDLQRLGTFYNNALLAPEKTGPGYATIGCLVGDMYPNLYQTQRVDKMQGIPTTDTAGWATNVETKELAIAHLVKLLSEEVTRIGDEEYGLMLHDEVTLMELRDYVKTEKGLGYGNSDGSEYDDGVMATAIMAAVDSIEPPPPAYVVHPDMDMPRRIALPEHGTGAVLLSGHETIKPPSDDHIYADDPADELPPAPVWEAWGKPREDPD